MIENQEIALGGLALALTAVSAYLLGYVRGSSQLHDAFLSGSVHRDESSCSVGQRQVLPGRKSAHEWKSHTSDDLISR